MNQTFDWRSQPHATVERDGIGYLMYKARLYGLTDVIVVGLAVYALLGFSTDLLVRFSARKALSWQSTLAH